jgi:hypothetical protein
MSEILFCEGAYVSNPRMPDWGLGKILELRDGGNLRVFFEGAAEKIMPPGNILPATLRGEHPLLAGLVGSTKIVKAKGTLVRARSLGQRGG